MRILLVIDSLGPGGAQRQMTMLARGLRKRGHFVALLNYYPQLDHFRQELVADDVRIIDAPKNRRFSLQPFVSVRRAIREYDIQVVLSFLDSPNIYAVLATVGIPDVAVVVSERFTFETDDVTLRMRLRFALYRLANRLTVNSQHTRRKIGERFSHLGDKTRTIYNGVDVDKFAPRTGNQELGSATISLLSIASVAGHKNASTLILALETCRQQGLDVRVTWAGAQETSLGGRSEYEKCVALLQEKGLQDCWEWLGRRADIADLINSHDALVHPSLMEGLPNVICEALASGKVVLAGNVGDHAMLLGSGDRGFLFDPTMPQDIARAVSEFAALDDTARMNMERRARQYAENELGERRYVSDYEDLFCHLLELN